MKLREAGIAFASVPLVLLSACKSNSSSPKVAALPSSSGQSSSSAAGAASQAAYDKCVRDHGGNPSPPAGSKGGIVSLSPDEAKAFEACASLAPPPPDTPQERKFNDEFRKALLKQAKCMRDHGIPYPDPTFDAQGNATNNLGDGYDANSPKVKKAEKECQPSGLGEVIRVPANGAPGTP